MQEHCSDGIRIIVSSSAQHMTVTTSLSDCWRWWSLGEPTEITACRRRDNDDDDEDVEVENQEIPIVLIKLFLEVCFGQLDIVHYKFIPKIGIIKKERCCL
jgi:hypothetical protein